MTNAIDLIDAAIVNLEAKLNLPPGGSILDVNKAQKKKQGNDIWTNTTTIISKETTRAKDTAKEETARKKPKKKGRQNISKKRNVANLDQPDICKLEFKVCIAHIN